MNKPHSLTESCNVYMANISIHSYIRPKMSTSIKSNCNENTQFFTRSYLFHLYDEVAKHKYRGNPRRDGNEALDAFMDEMNISFAYVRNPPKFLFRESTDEKYRVISKQSGMDFTTPAIFKLWIRNARQLVFESAIIKQGVVMEIIIE